MSEQELNIGRGPENDWVLQDTNRHLSKRHCTLSLRNGRWAVTDRSTNGTFVNRDIQPVGDGQTRNLRDGDRLRLGLYEIEIRISDEETLQGRHAAWVTQAAIDTPAGDPFGGDPFTDVSRAPRQTGSVLPPDGPDATLPQDGIANPLLPRAGEPDTAFLAPRQLPPTTLIQPVATQWGGHQTPTQETVNVPPPREEPVRRTGTARPLAAFLRGAGVPEAEPGDPEAVMESLGATFRALVVGLREVMITRAKIKGEFRIEQTLMRSQGNNPLKFSADDEDALAALLGIGRRIDMKPADAVAAALRDLQAHELAAMAGMKAGMRAALSRVDPERIAAGIEAGGADGLPPPAKLRAWDAYVRQHAAIAASAPDDLEGIFGRAFARGYEQNLKDIE